MRNKLCVGLLAVMAGGYLLRRQGTRWGATDEEVHKPLAGDEIVPHPMVETTHALSLHASAPEVWPWLVQMGYYRAGWYTDPSWWDKLADEYLKSLVRKEAQESGTGHREVPSADRIVPELQDLKEGDTIADGPPGTAFFTARLVERNRALVLYSDSHLRYAVPKSIRDNPRYGIYGEFSWAFVLEEKGERNTRLILRTRADYGPRLYRALTLPFILAGGEALTARKMLYGIKRRAERNTDAPNGITDGKVVLVTGGTGGIGKDIAQGLASMGASVVVVGRDRGKGEAAVAEIKARSGNEAVELMVADLSSQAEIHRLASEFEAHYDRLDVLVNNAGAMYSSRWETAEGIEGTLAVIHLAPVLLTSLLLPMLRRSAPSRIVNVSSWSHRRAKLNLDDLQMREHYSASTAYSRAKLINLLWTYGLARRLEGTGVTVNLADPGGASTEMTRSEAMPWILRTINRLGQKVMTTEKAARVSIYLASSPEVEGVNGAYFDSNNKQIKSSKASYEEEAQKRIWEVSAELAKLDPSMPLRGANRVQ